MAFRGYVRAIISREGAYQGKFRWDAHALSEFLEPLRTTAAVGREYVGRPLKAAESSADRAVSGAV